MKTKLLLSTLLSFYFCLLSSQIPQGFNYQAIARGSDGKEITNTVLQVKISILSDTTGFYSSGTGNYIWEEQQSVTTNSLGFFALIVGNPSATYIKGSATSFSAIDWSKTPLYIGTKIYYQGNWKNMGSPQLWSVPYSMIAGNLEGAVKKLEVMGEDTQSDEALFEVKRKDGQTMFAVYNHGVRIYMPLDTLSKAKKGGFAIGGFNAAKGEIQDYFVVNPDSIRAYIDTNPGKALKGGFAIGGFGTAKAAGEEYLRVTRDSTRVYLNDTEGKATKGGFAIGGFSSAKGKKEYMRVTNDSTRIFTGDSLSGFGVGSLATGIPANYLKLTPANYFIGHDAGKVTTTGKFNSFIGYQSGIKNTIGHSNTFMGYQSGYNNKTGIGNLYIGYQAGYTSTSGGGSQFIGYQSGYSNTTGTVNTFVGTYSGLMNTKGSYNTYVGNNSGGLDSIGKYNAYFGFQAGSQGQGSYNTYIGAESGDENVTGTHNSYLGIYSGQRSTGSNNVFLGYNSGTTSDASNSVYLGYNSGSSFDRSNSLIIANSNATPYESSSLIYGEFDNKFLRINGQLYLPYNSGNSVLTMISGNGNSFNFKPEADLIRIQSNYTGNPTIMTLDKYGQVGIGSTLTINGGLYAAVTSGNVGIGTSTPTFPLHVYKSPSTGSWLSSFQNGTVTVQLAYGPGAGIYMNTNNTSAGLYGLDVYNGSSHVLYAGNDGSVGLGTNFPSFPFHVYRSSATTSWLTSFQNGSTYVQMAYGPGCGIFLSTANTSSSYYGLDVYNGSSHVLFARNDGNVGIGTNAPLYKLDVMGTAKLGFTTVASDAIEINSLGSGNRNAYIDFHGDDTYTDYGLRILRSNTGANAPSYIYHCGTGAFNIITSQAGPINFYTNSSHRMTITPSGFVGIGTTAPGAYNLYVNGTTWSTGGWGGSDIRWKKDIEPLGNVLQDIVQLCGVRYSWRREEFPEMNFDSSSQIGLVAQDVEKIFPLLVKTNDDGYKAIAYDKLSVILVEAIKEQQKQIQSTKQENFQLRSELKSLREEIDQIKAMITKGGMK